MRKAAPAVLVFLVTVFVLRPYALSLPQHGDEKRHVWKGAYYAGRLVRLDFSPPGADLYLNPGWDPLAHWAIDKPMGSHWVYALALGLTGSPAPAKPYSYTDATLQGPDTAIPAETLPAVRGAAVFCAALGLALIAWRLGWRGAVAAGLFLLIPHVPPDLALAWDEGPLLLTVGLAVLTYGTPWFIVAAGAAAGVKLTGLVLWPLVFWRHPLGRSRLRHVAGLFVTSLVWAAITPYSWLVGGPAYLVLMLVYRLQTYLSQTAGGAGDLGELLASERVFGFFWPTRYTWPLELGLCLLITTQVPRLWRRWRSRRAAGRPKTDAE
ncbi:MAG: hypothetical protein GX601_08455 [Anaerolineales bacterium]|nr:hypothetical protein [Anaerolineales bacterium]